MDLELATGSRAVQEAVSAGLLIDVTETAAKVGMPYRTTMTPSLLARFRTDAKIDLEGILSVITDLYASCSGYDYYGPINAGIMVCIIEPHEEFGHVLLILDRESMETLDLKRTTGSRAEYAM